MICRHCEELINEEPIQLHSKCYHRLLEIIKEWEQKGAMTGRAAQKLLGLLEQKLEE